MEIYLITIIDSLVFLNFFFFEEKLEKNDESKWQKGMKSQDLIFYIWSVAGWSLKFDLTSSHD